MPRLWIPLLALVFCLHAPAYAEHEWNGVERVVAIGDVHGDYDQFFTLLQQSGLTDEKGKWTGGKAHLVQTGDIPDRGPDTRQIIDFMMRLEKQAKRAGGQVHALIGNHDAMNIYGDLRYVTPEEFEAFRTGRSARIRDAFWEQHAEELQRSGKIADAAARAAWYEEHPLGYFEHRLAWGPNGDYGQWVMEHNTVVKVNDSLFVHAGISPRLARMSMGEINERVRAELKDFSLLKEGLTIASDGPIWYRGLAQGDEQELMPHVDAALSHFGVKRIVIGHTPTAGTVIPRFGGKVVMIDVGLSEHYGGRLACLVIEDREPHVLHRGTRLDLPKGDAAELAAYLKRAATLDPEPSPLLPLVQQLEQAMAAGSASAN